MCEVKNDVQTIPVWFAAPIHLIPERVKISILWESEPTSITQLSCSYCFMMRESDLEIWRLQNKESELAVFSVASQPKYDKNMFTFSSAKESTFTL